MTSGPSPGIWETEAAIFLADGFAVVSGAEAKLVIENSKAELRCRKVTRGRSQPLATPVVNPQIVAACRLSQTGRMLPALAPKQDSRFTAVRSKLLPRRAKHARKQAALLAYIAWNQRMSSSLESLVFLLPLSRSMSLLLRRIVIHRKGDTHQISGGGLRAFRAGNAGVNFKTASKVRIPRERQYFKSGLMIVRGTPPRAIALSLWPHRGGLGHSGERTMKARLITAAALMAAFAAPAFAEEFYVVQDTATKKCTIVDKKPTVATETIVSPSGTVYKTRAEAEAGMKTVKVCTSN